MPGRPFVRTLGKRIRDRLSAGRVYKRPMLSASRPSYTKHVNPFRYQPITAGRIPILGRGQEEVKFVDTPSAVKVPVSGASTIDFLNDIAAGTDYSERIGRSIKLISLQVHGYASPQDDTTDYTYCRYIIVHDRQPQGALPAVADILASDTPYSFTKWDNKNRFAVLRDAAFAIGKVDTTATQSFAGGVLLYPLDIFVPLNNIEMKFSATAGAIANVVQGAIYMICMSTGAANASVQFKLATRIRFSE